MAFRWAPFGYMSCRVVMVDSFDNEFCTELKLLK